MKPLMIDKYTYLAAGINTKTMRPIRDSANGFELKDKCRTLLRIIDEQDFISRYKWFNIPINISGEELERLFYYKGQMIFFYFKEIGKFCVMPYALNGTIDFYGRYNTVTPIPFFTGEDKGDKEKVKVSADLLALLGKKKLNVIYEIQDEENVTEDMLYNSAVIIRDYSLQLPQNIIPRAVLQEPILDLESDILPFVRTNLIMGSGVKGMRVPDADSKNEATDTSKALYRSALEGTPLAPFTSAVETQDVFGGNQRAKVDEFFIALQTIDNMRLKALGLDNGGLFEKKSHMLESEMSLNGNKVDGAYTDGLYNRQNAVNIINSIWGLGMWVEPKESPINEEIMMGENKPLEGSKSTSSEDNSSGEEE